MFGTNHSLIFWKLTLRFDEVFSLFPSGIALHAHTFSCCSSQCLSESAGGLMGSHVAISIFSNSAKRYYTTRNIGYRSSRHQEVSPPTNSPPICHLATNQLATKQSHLATKRNLLANFNLITLTYKPKTLSRTLFSCIRKLALFVFYRTIMC